MEAAELGDLDDAVEGVAALFRGEDNEKADAGALLLTKFLVQVIRTLQG